MRRPLILIAALLALLPLPATASAQGEGVQRLHYEFGPIHISPGQNTIELASNDLKPPVDGWIVGFRPNLRRADGTVPRVDAIHLHHGVWLSDGAPMFAAGEEKTELRTPQGYGWRYRTSDQWVMNHMIHNLKPDTEDVFITYDLDFIPADSPAAAGMREVRTLWMDVMGLQPYPVFDVHKRAGGRDRRYTYPDESGQPGYRRNRVTVPEDGVLVGTAGHLHPGGLWTDLKLTRDGRTVPLFRSRARYFEPAGAVSWDVAMEVTPSSWRVGVKRGDVLSISATYDTRRASWYESMGIMVLAFSPGGSGPDPFTTNVNLRGDVTHGALPENRNHGGGLLGLPDARDLLAAPPARSQSVDVRGFVYGQGDLGLSGRRGLPPTVRAGRSLRFVNRDARTGADGVMHTITSCRAPCNRATGIAYPLADGPVRFDSGNLGFGPAGFTPAAQRATWSTPRGLRPGTYTYFCRVHPFMRGAFRVKR
jgi:plastocyanin